MGALLGGYEAVTKGKIFHHLAAKLWSLSRPVTCTKIYINSGQINLVEAGKILTCIRKMSVLNFGWDIGCLSEGFISSIQSTVSRFHCSHPFQLSVYYYPISWTYMLVTSTFNQQMHLYNFHLKQFKSLKPLRHVSIFSDHHHLSTTDSYTTWYAATTPCLQKRTKLWIGNNFS